MFQTKSHRQSHGQATVESVLLIALTVFIVLSLMVMFFQPLNKWLDNYMGSYVTCLIDVGELPNLGAGTEGECDSRYENFTIGEGRQPIPGGGYNPSNPNDPNNPPRRNPPNSSTSGSSGGGGTGRNRLSSSSLGFQTKGTGADGAAGTKEIRTELPEELAQTTYFRSQSRINVETQGRQKRITATGVTGLLKAEKEKQDRENARVRVVDSGANAPQSKSKKFQVKTPERKVAATEDDEPWNIGKILRWSLIILLILAILLFVGGQVLQITKSMEK